MLGIQASTSSKLFFQYGKGAVFASDHYAVFLCIFDDFSCEKDIHLLLDPEVICVNYDHIGADESGHVYLLYCALRTCLTWSCACLH